jgi:hypothetical protein
MPTAYRATHPDREEITDIGSIEAIDRVIRSGEPGRYHTDQISGEPMPLGHTSRRWGAKIKPPDGSIVDDPVPWPDR